MRTGAIGVLVGVGPGAACTSRQVLGIGVPQATAIAAADAVMIGSPLARATDAPGRGFHWGTTTFHSGLPRGVRIASSPLGTAKEILMGPDQPERLDHEPVRSPEDVDGDCGYESVKDLQKAEVVIRSLDQDRGQVRPTQPGDSRLHVRRCHVGKQRAPRSEYLRRAKLERIAVRPPADELNERIRDRDRLIWGCHPRTWSGNFVIQTNLNSDPSED
jgi:IMP dehydrogenase/GMP reductase-like protein